MNIGTKKRLLLAALVSVVFMAVLLLQVDWKHFSLIAERIVITDMLVAFILLFLANCIRTLRFYKIDHLGNRLSQWWVMNQIYNLMTATLPGGPGEAATVYFLKKFSAFNIISGFRILFLTRVMDLTGLSCILLFAAYQISRTTPYREAALLTSAVLFIISIIVTHPISERFIFNMLQKVQIKGRMMDAMNEKFKDIARMSGNDQNGKYFIVTMMQSVLIIVTAALSVHFVLRSFGIGFGLVQSLYCFGVYAIFQIVPVQGIAGIGTQAAWWSVALTVTGYTDTDAIAMGIVLHGTFYVFIALMGLSAILFISFNRKNM